MKTDTKTKNRLLDFESNMNISLLFMIIIILIAAFFFGCSRYPFGMQKDEWNALSREQQNELAETEKLFDQYNLDSNRCRKKSEVLLERQFGTRIIGGGEKINIQLGKNKDTYEKCMEQSGWSDEKLQQIINWLDDPINE
jgi:preprotein translocase subunit SecF